MGAQRRDVSGHRTPDRLSLAELSLLESLLGRLIAEVREAGGLKRRGETGKFRYRDRGIFVVKGQDGRYYRGSIAPRWSSDRDEAKEYKLRAWAARAASLTGGEVIQEE